MPTAPRTMGQLGTRHRNQSSTQRGYNYAWHMFRKRALANPEDYGLPAMFGFCADCLPRLVLTREIHHKIRMSSRPDLKYTASNLVGLCASCHSKRTARGE